MELPTAVVRGQRTREPRWHFLVSAPATLALLVCLALPSYQDCGQVVRTTDSVVLEWPIGFAAAVLVLAIALYGHRRERAAAIFALLIGVVLLLALAGCAILEGALRDGVGLVGVGLEADAI